MTSSSDILLGKISQFAAYLRKQGMKVGLGEVQDAMRALNMTGCENPETVKTVLDTALCEKPKKTNAKNAQAAMPDVLPAKGTEAPAGLKA